MTQLKETLNQIVRSGYHILIELDNEQPDIDKIKNLYEKRSKKITKLDNFSEKKTDNLSEEERTTLRNLFTQLHLLEKKLNKNLRTMAKDRKEDLKQMGLHRKARSSYDQNNRRGNHRKILDLKPNS